MIVRRPRPNPLHLTASPSLSFVPLNHTIVVANSMRAIGKHSLLGILVSLSLWCARAEAESTQAALPEAVTMNEGAGCGNWLILTLRLENGEKLPFMVDTGTPITLLDKSLEGKLGERLETMGLRFAATGLQEAGVHAAPRLLLGSTTLATSRYAAACNLKPLSRRSRQRIMGVLGFDCLRHYCIQLDFAAGKMRFLDSDSLNTTNLGKAFALTFSTKGQKFSPMFSSAGQNEALPFIQHTGLFGGASTDLLVDTGNNCDGTVEKGVIKGHYLTRFAHWLFPIRALRLRQCVWDDKTYTRLKVVTTRSVNQLGLRFLARHLVTFDFPKHTMYLKQISSGPLGAELTNEPRRH
jgi:hypothetical protein